jgi:N-acetylneuraminate lyase
VNERKALVEAWCAASSEHLKVIAHIGCESILDTKELAVHAKSVGCAAVAFMPPSFIKPGSVAALADYVAEVCATVPDVPCYYYHIPIMTHVNLSMVGLMEAVHGRVPNFRGMKYTDFDMHTFNSLVHFADKKYDILYGRDEQMLTALALGGTGFVGSTYNYMGRIYHQLINYWEALDVEAARKLQLTSCKVVDLLMAAGRFGGGNVGKAIMGLRLGDKGSVGPPRAPGTAVPEDGVAKLRAELEALRFFAW